jgi:hypothetical protein
MSPGGMEEVLKDRYEKSNDHAERVRHHVFSRQAQSVFF